MNPKFSEYAHPDALVDADWVQAHLADPFIRIVESNEDIFLYDTGHIPGAVHIDWYSDLQDELVRDYVSAESFASVCSRHGIGPDTTVVFYGDKSNWWAAYALWTFVLFGHTRVKLLDGGRDKWKADERPVSREKPNPATVPYPCPAKPDERLVRAFFSDALAQSKARRPLVDVRNPAEYRGEITHMPEYPQEGVLRGGHIPGAVNLFWKIAVNDDSTFRPFAELQRIYAEPLGTNKDADIVVYCRIGERSSHTWFVLTYLLGYKNVRNYDGSWTEWGNTVRAPIAKGELPS